MGNPILIDFGILNKPHLHAYLCSGENALAFKRFRLLDVVFGGNNSENNIIVRDCCLTE